MKVRYTDEALRDLDEILAYIATHYPGISASFQKRLRAIERRIGEWPNSAREVEGKPGVRMVPLIRYPYRLFYRVTNDDVEILYIHHGARHEA
jgi:toxin ParE1/3/4